MSIKCIIIDDDEMTRRYLSQYAKKYEELELVATCESGQAGRKALEKEDIDLIFLDVQLPEMTGFDLIDGLKTAPKVVLISSSSQYGIQAFEHEVSDYLHKPISLERFERAVEKVKKELETFGKSTPNHRYLYVKKGSTYVKVALEDILWIEAYADYVIIKTAEQSYITHSTMKGMEKRLPKDDFKRVHRSYIVRWDKIDSIEDMTLAVGRKMIPIGGTYRREFKQYLKFVS